MSYYYPPINEKHIILLKKLSSQHDDYFTASDCPYGASVKVALSPGSLDSELEDIGDLEDSSVLLVQTQKLYRELQAMGSTFNPETTSAERNTYFKLSANLLEKLLEMQERIVNTSTLARVQELMLQIMADEITVDDRNNILKRLKDAAEPV